MGRILLITGAGGGLGSLVAQNEANNFSELILLERNKAKLDATAAAISNSGGAKPHLAIADVSSEKQLTDALSPFASIDCVVNAAGVLGPVRKLGEGKWEEWRSALDVNLFGTAMVCGMALQKMPSGARGKIVNFAGGGAANSRPYHTAYAASKAGVVRLTEILAEEHPQLDANVIAPGAHKTGIWDTETHDKPPAKWADKGRFCALASFLLSPRSDGITGKFIHIYDKWEDFTPAISKSGMYTMRRIEPKRE